MKLLSLFLILFLSFSLNAQESDRFANVDDTMRRMPESLSHSAGDIAGYIRSSFPGDVDRLHGLFCWLSDHILYDIPNKSKAIYYKNENELVEGVLKTRTGVCVHYATLFCYVARQLGIKSYVVSGYTRQHGKIDSIPHSWCACRVDGGWYLFDPTWGSGYISEDRYVKHLNDSFFMVKPEQLIHSHMPFDPLWQLQDFPLSNQDFYDEKFDDHSSSKYFNFKDTLSLYDQQPELERLISSVRRIRQNGVKNELITERLRQIDEELSFRKSQLQVDQYNAAVAEFNEGIRNLNAFVEYRNRQFSPHKTDDEINEMLIAAAAPIDHAQRLLSEIKEPDQNSALAVNGLKKSIAAAQQGVKEHRDFLDKYFKTGKVFRKTLFYKYTWMGIPLNK